MVFSKPRSTLAPIFLAGLVFSCSSPELALVPDDSPPPLDMTLRHDGVTYAGAASVDITPNISETFTDLNGDALFDGCLDNPAGGTEECPEPFDDANGNGQFDAVFIGGFSPLRPALSVNDPLYARAFVISQDGEYIAFVSLDLVGLGSPRIHAARDALVADGFDPDRLMVASTHNHQGPDTMGFWGDPYDMGNPKTGIREEYQQRVTAAIEDAVRKAASVMEPVVFRVGSLSMRDRSPHFNGALFGGKNPTAKMHGMINDIRDPVIVSDQLLVMQGLRNDGTAVFTTTIWSGHPETRGDLNNAISSDWVGVTRTVIEERFGGLAIHMPECLGGMQSALSGDLPLVDEEGIHQYQSCKTGDVNDPADSECFGRALGEPRVDSDGDWVPVWAPRDSREFVVSHGWHIAEAAIAALDDSKRYAAAPIAVEAETFHVPIHNVAYNLLGRAGIFDLGLEDAIRDEEICPEASAAVLGCIPTRTFRIVLGPIGLITAPAEILPELAWGFPDDPRWLAQSTQLQARGEGSEYFPQHDPTCNTLSSFEECRRKENVGDCDCLQLHNWPYTLSNDPQVPPMLSLMDTEYRASLSMVDNYISYMIPEPDVNRAVSLLSDRDGDHYEDTVSPSYLFATRWQEAQLRIAKRLGQ